MLRNFWNDENGFVISAELVLVLTIAVLSMIVGLAEVSTAVITELNDISNAIGFLDQSYFLTGFGARSGVKPKAWTNGASFVDHTDDCDTNTTCDIVCAAGTVTSGETP